MAKKILSKYIRKTKRWVRKQKVSTKLFIVLFICLGITYAYYMNTRRLSVDLSTYTPLMSLIGEVESNNNYNAYFGSPQNHKIKFTDMTIEDVMKWQSDFVSSGSPSSAVGRYQIISTTLAGLVKELKIDPKQKFDPKTQDRMAITLLERRGSTAYVNNELSSEEFAANLAKEWAALPKVTGNNPDSSYYASDGLNVARITSDKVLSAIRVIKAN